MWAAKINEHFASTYQHVYTHTRTQPKESRKKLKINTAKVESNDV